jgi:hypothetical protein
MHTEGTEKAWWKGWHRDGNQPVAGPHPDPDTSYETLHGSLDVNLQVYPIYPIKYGTYSTAIKCIYTITGHLQNTVG